VYEYPRSSYRLHERARLPIILLCWAQSIHTIIHRIDLSAKSQDLYPQVANYVNMTMDNHNHLSSVFI
jgi:hypothetical protein